MLIKSTPTHVCENDTFRITAACRGDYGLKIGRGYIEHLNQCWLISRCIYMPLTVTINSPCQHIYKGNNTLMILHDEWLLLMLLSGNRPGAVLCCIIHNEMSYIFGMEVPFRELYATMNYILHILPSNHCTLIKHEGNTWKLKTPIHSSQLWQQRTILNYIFDAYIRNSVIAMPVKWSYIRRFA